MLAERSALRSVHLTAYAVLAASMRTPYLRCVLRSRTRSASVDASERSFGRLCWRRAFAFAWCAAAAAVCVRCIGTSSLISDSTLRQDRRAPSSPRVVLVMDTNTHTHTQVVDLKTTYNLEHSHTHTKATPSTFSVRQRSQLREG